MTTEHSEVVECRVQVCETAERSEAAELPSEMRLTSAARLPSEMRLRLLSAECMRLTSAARLPSVMRLRRAECTVEGERRNKSSPPSSCRVVGFCVTVCAGESFFSPELV